MASGSLSSGDSYDEEAAVRRPLELDGRDAAVSASSSSDYLPGSAVHRYQASSVKGDTNSKYYEKWRQPTTDDVRKSNPGSRYFMAFAVDLSLDNIAVAIVYFVQGVLGTYLF